MIIITFFLSQVLLLAATLLMVHTSANAFFLPSLDSVLGNSVPRIHRSQLIWV